MLYRFGSYLEVYWNAKVEKGGTEHRFNCPECPDISQHFSFNIEAGVSNCWKCGYNPSPYVFLTTVGNMTSTAAKEMVAEQFVGKTKVKEEEKAKTVEIPEGTLPVNKVTGGLAALFGEWMDDSGITMKDAMKLGFGIDIQEGSKSYGRIIIPITEDGEQTYWIGRAMLDSVEYPYLFPEGRRGLYVWGLDSMDIKEGEIFICEGWKDAYKMRGVGLLGNSLSDEQMDKILSRIPPKCDIGVMLDVDAFKEAKKVAFKLYITCNKQRNVNLYNITKFKDPGQTANRKEALSSSLIFNLNLLTDRVKVRTKSKRVSFK